MTKNVAKNALKVSGLLIAMGLMLPALAQEEQEGQAGLMVIETRYPGEYIADSEGFTLYTLVDPTTVATGTDGDMTGGDMTGGAEGEDGAMMEGEDGAMTGGDMTGGDMAGDAEGEEGAMMAGEGAGVLPCEADCLEAWPPFTTDSEDAAQSLEVTGGTEDLSGMLGTMELEDGTYQVTFGGYPLYYFSGDEAAGDFNGLAAEGFGGVWYMISTEGNVLAAEEGTAQ